MGYLCLSNGIGIIRHWVTPPKEKSDGMIIYQIHHFGFGNTISKSLARLFNSISLWKFYRIFAQVLQTGTLVVIFFVC